MDHMTVCFSNLFKVDIQSALFVKNLLHKIRPFEIGWQRLPAQTDYWLGDCCAEDIKYSPMDTSTTNTSAQNFRKHLP
jgi:hypothetical protein